MSVVSRRRALARLATVLFCLSAMLVPHQAPAGEAKRKTRSALDQVLFDTNPSSWRAARVDANAFSPRSDDTGPARFFTISAVLTRGSGADAPRNAVASLDGGVVSDTAPLPLVDMTDEPYGLRLFRAPEGMAWNKWRAVGDQMRAEISTIDQCRVDSESCSAEVARFVDLTDRARLKSGRERLSIINSGINDAIHYQSDLSHHGVVDLWSAPIATLKDGAGDCEDYAIAKYLALQQAGISTSDIKVLLVRDTASAQDHAITVVRLDGRWVVLDNRWSEIVDTSAASRLLPRFAMDEDGVKLFASRFAMVEPVESEFDLIPASSEFDADEIAWSSFSN
jgi:predicted transglutaminase-like cysteine proteinase